MPPQRHVTAAGLLYEPMRNSILSQIGNTPLIDLSTFLPNPHNVRLFGKAEWFNASGSVKDRAILSIILDGEKRGSLRKGKIVLDATSGNAGISYAMIGAVKGYKVKLTVPKSASIERKKILAAYGAELVYTDPLEGSDGAIREARRIYFEQPERYFYGDQYNNPANVEAHYNSTGPEIWEQTKGAVTHFVAGVGTSGTLMGAGKRLKELKPTVKLIEVQPDSSFHGIEGLKHMSSSIEPGIYDPSFADEHLAVRTEDAQAVARQLAKKLGVLVGVSSGAAVSAAIRIAEDLRDGVIVGILPDGGDKYLSERFWEEAP